MSPVHQALMTSSPARVQILVVEDDPLFQRLIRAALMQVDFVAHTLVAGSLAEARRLLAETTPHCVLLDLHLPDSQGLDTVQALMAVAPNTPVVVLTEETQGKVADAALLAGAQDFLDKSQVQPRALGRTIRYAVDRGQWTADMRAKNRELESRNKDLDDFAHAVSHDLKAPLRGLFGAVVEAQDHLRAGRPAQAHDLLAAMEPRIRRLFDMIDGVLRVTRAGRDTGRTPVDVASVLRDVLDNLRVPSHFRITSPTTLPQVVGDRTGLGQVFQNLLDNAIKHHPGPRGHIDIRWRELEAHHEFTVADDGAGIPADLREAVFQLFRTSGRAGGTGIGLSLVQKVVQAHGGTIVVEANEPCGSRFRFTWSKAGA